MDNESDQNIRLVSTKEAARILGVSVAFLERDRWAGNLNEAGPRIPYVRTGKRAVRYRLADLRDHIQNNLIS